MTDIVPIPQTLPIAPFPALGAANYNQEAYDNGISVPPAIERAREIVEAGRINSQIAKDAAEAAVPAAAQATEARDQVLPARDETLAARDQAVPAAEVALDAAQRAEEAVASIEGGPVASVNGQTGVVTLSAADVGAAPEHTFLARVHAAVLAFS